MTAQWISSSGVCSANRLISSRETMRIRPYAGAACSPVSGRRSGINNKCFLLAEHITRQWRPLEAPARRSLNPPLPHAHKLNPGQAPELGTASTTHLFVAFPSSFVSPYLSIGIQCPVPRRLLGVLLCRVTTIRVSLFHLMRRLSF